MLFGSDLASAIADLTRCREALRAYDGHLPFVRDVMQGCGLTDLDLDDGSTENFRCVLPEHSRTAHANLWRSGSGAWVYRDHAPSAEGWASYCMAEVYAAHITERVGRIEWDGREKSERLHRRNGAELAVWKVRALVQYGYVKAPQLGLGNPPPGESENVQKLWEGVTLLASVRRLMWPDDDAMPLARSFIGPWSHLHPVTAGRATHRLQELGIIVLDSRRVPEGGGRQTRYWKLAVPTL